MKGNFLPEEIRSWLCGQMVAMATPFTEDFALDLDSLQQNIHFMIDHGVTTGQGSLLVAAAAGEHPVLNIEERKAAMEAAVEAAAGRVPVLTSIQHTDTRVIVELAQHASKVGIQGAQLNATYYYEATEADILRQFRIVAEASDVTIMIYRVGVMRQMGLDLIRRLAELETVRVLKFAAKHRDEFREGVAAFSKDLVVIDNSLQHIWGHMLGTRGFITHIGNFWPEHTLQIWQLLEKGEYRAAKEKLDSFTWSWGEWRNKVTQLTGGEAPFIKAAMEAAGLPAGPPRPPSARPPEDLLRELRERLDSAGVPQARLGAARGG